jgi:hypothetical protein
MFYHRVNIITESILSPSQYYHRVNIITESILSPSQYYHRVNIITESTLFRWRLDGNLNYTTQQLKNRIITIKYYLLKPLLSDISLISAV